MKTVKRRIAELVEDFSLYPRSVIDDVNVWQLVMALENGNELPPIVIEKGTLRIVDGFHRVRAHRRVFGEDAEIECIGKSYENDLELLLDAGRLNWKHGARLSQYDRARFLILADKLGASQEQIKDATGLLIDRTNKQRIKPTARYKKEEVPLKRAFCHLKGEQLTSEQYDALRKSGGQHWLFQVNELIRNIRADALPEDDEKLDDALRLLASLLIDRGYGS